MPVCGIEKAYIALLTSDTTGGLIYGTPAYYQNVQELDIKPKTNTDKAYAENRLVDQAAQFDSADVTMNLYDLISAQRAEILGQAIASAGGTVASSGDEAPFVAILYKSPLRKGAYRYGVLYKGQFQPDDMTMKGVEGKPDLSQVPKLIGTFQPTDYQFTDGTKVKHPWEYHVDTTDPNCPADIDDTWFDAVTVPGADITPPTVITTPLDAATSVAVTANMIWTFDEAIASACMTAANFFIMKAADGTLVAGALTIDGTGKIVTLDPTASLTAATPYIAICTTNVTDLAGNHLANTSITNFTTAS